MATIREAAASLPGPLKVAWFPDGEAGTVFEERERSRTWPELARRGIWLDRAALIAV